MDPIATESAKATSERQADLPGKEELIDRGEKFSQPDAAKTKDVVLNSLEALNLEANRKAGEISQQWKALDLALGQTGAVASESFRDAAKERGESFTRPDTAEQLSPEALRMSELGAEYGVLPWPRPIPEDNRSRGQDTEATMLDRSAGYNDHPLRSSKTKPTEQMPTQSAKKLGTEVR